MGASASHAAPPLHDVAYGVTLNAPKHREAGAAGVVQKAVYVSRFNGWRTGRGVERDGGACGLGVVDGAAARGH